MRACVYVRTKKPPKEKQKKPLAFSLSTEKAVGRSTQCTCLFVVIFYREFINNFLQCFLKLLLKEVLICVL